MTLSIVYATLGDNIKRARKAANLTQPELGRACGWGEESQSRVSNYERGRRVPPVNDLVTIAKVLGVDMNQLLYGAEHPQSSSLGAKIRMLSPEARAQIEGIVDTYLIADQLPKK